MPNKPLVSPAGRDHEGKNGVQSLDIGMTILRAIGSGHRAMMLKDIAAAVDMPASKVHRYMVSLVRCGMVEQDPMTSRYDLGPFALNLGLVAVDRLDRVKLGLAAIADLRDEVNQTTALAIWSDNGPVIVRSVRPFRPITVHVVTGTAMHLLTSACGRVFAACLPRSVTEARIRCEQDTLSLPAELKTPAGLAAMLDQVQQQGVAIVDDDHRVPGVAAAAAPVYNFKHGITLCIMVIGVNGMIDLAPDAAVVNPLKRSAQALSMRLGHNSPR
ncbi:MAG: IclR family transcriptional regulator [Rhodoferax sp.]|jgi:DNA-binding IclR family transcriptional regulator|nr:IclR family transcriptional regulator [Rhodoferax sp.]